MTNVFAVEWVPAKEWMTSAPIRPAVAAFPSFVSLPFPVVVLRS